MHTRMQSTTRSFIAPPKDANARELHLRAKGSRHAVQDACELVRRVVAGRWRQLVQVMGRLVQLLCCAPAHFGQLGNDPLDLQVGGHTRQSSNRIEFMQSES